MIIGVDIGKEGGIATDIESIMMPTTINIIKPARMQFALVNGKKQLIKSGPNKGQYKQKIMTPAKTARELDLALIYDTFQTWYDGASLPNTVVLEQPGNSVGNSARSTATTYLNYGKLLACAELAGCKIVTVAASKWKKDLGLTKDKLECVERAEELSGLDFRGPSGGLKDGPAEAWLIRYWFIHHGEIE